MPPTILLAYPGESLTISQPFYIVGANIEPGFVRFGVNEENRTVTGTAQEQFVLVLLAV
jgi:hypothetical protein